MFGGNPRNHLCRRAPHISLTIAIFGSMTLSRLTILRFSLSAPDADDVSHFVENDTLEDSAIFHGSDVINVERHSSSKANCLVCSKVV